VFVIFDPFVILSFSINRRKSVLERLLEKTSFLIAFFVLILIPACNARSGNIINITPTLAIDSTDPTLETLPIPTKLPTATATEPTEPTATSTPTPEGIVYENWGNNPETFTRYLIEKHGVMIPFNPVDNPEEFYEEINRIAYDSQMIEELGFIKPSKEKSSGYDPVLKRSEIVGEIVMPFQVMFFQYKGENFPFIITDQNRTNNEVVLIYDNEYEDFITHNVKNNDVTFWVREDASKESIELIRNRGSISDYMADLVSKTGLSLGILSAQQ
jgi:hypothetical protein